MSEDFIDWLLSHKIVQVILEKVIFFVVSPHGIFIIITAFIAYYGIKKWWSERSKSSDDR